MLKKKKCAICGKLAELSADHIPPRCLFPKPLPNKMITVKTCSECNGGTSTDDQYFKTMLVMRQDSGPESRKLWESVAKSLVKPEARGFFRSVLGSVISLERKTKAGIYLGDSPGIRVDAKRIQNMIGKIIRGLYFNQFKVRLPEHHDVIIVDERDFFEEDPDSVIRLANLQATLSVRPTKVGDGKVFQYWCRPFPDDQTSCFWVLSFYEHNYFIAFNGPFFSGLQAIAIGDGKK